MAMAVMLNMENMDMAESMDIVMGMGKNHSDMTVYTSCFLQYHHLCHQKTTSV